MRSEGMRIRQSDGRVVRMELGGSGWGVTLAWPGPASPSLSLSLSLSLSQGAMRFHEPGWLWLWLWLWLDLAGSLSPAGGDQLELRRLQWSELRSSKVLLLPNSRY